MTDRPAWPSATAGTIKRRQMSIDEKCAELAEHFMSDVKGHSAAHVRDLAEAFQTAAEDHCSMAEADVSADAPDEAEVQS